MSPLQELVITGADGSVVKTEEMEALFGGLNKMVPLHYLTCDFNARGSRAPLMKSFHPQESRASETGWNRPNSGIGCIARSVTS